MDKLTFFDTEKDLRELTGIYCVGFQHTEYNGKHYYLLYHS